MRKGTAIVGLLLLALGVCFAFMACSARLWDRPNGVSYVAGSTSMWIPDGRFWAIDNATFAEGIIVLSFMLAGVGLIWIAARRTG